MLRTSRILPTLLALAFLFPSLATAQEEAAPPPNLPVVYLLTHVEEDELVGVLAVTQLDAQNYLGVYFPADPESLNSSSTLAVLGNWLQTYTDDTIGNITKVTDTSGTNGYQTIDYAYDNLFRLTSASSTLAVIADWLQTFAYDNLGNLTSKSDVGSYSYTGTGYTNPHAATTIGGTNYTYDNAGNLLTSGNGTATTTNTWNYRNRLTDTNGGGGASATTTHYAYDENDQRVVMEVKSSGATTTTKTFNQYYETSTQGSNSTTTTNIYLPDGTLLATVEGNGSATTTSVIHTDHLGGTNVVSSETGSQRQLNNYYPYGALRQNETSGVTEIRKKYLSQNFDSATSLNYLNARYQNGAEGRFISQDPVARDIGMMQKMPAYILAFNQANGEIDQTMLLADPQLLNSYSYAGNNPVTMKDPSGKCPICIALTGGYAFGIGKGLIVNSVSNLSAGRSAAEMFLPATGSNPANLPVAQWYATQGTIDAGKAAGLMVLATSKALSIASGSVLGAWDAYTNSKETTEKADVSQVVGGALVGAGSAAIMNTLPGVPGPYAKLENLLGSARAAREYVGSIPTAIYAAIIETKNQTQDQSQGKTQSVKSNN